MPSARVRVRHGCEVARADGMLIEMADALELGDSSKLEAFEDEAAYGGSPRVERKGLPTCADRTRGV